MHPSVTAWCEHASDAAAPVSARPFPRAARYQTCAFSCNSTAQLCRTNQLVPQIATGASCGEAILIRSTSNPTALIHGMARVAPHSCTCIFLRRGKTGALPTHKTPAPPCPLPYLAQKRRCQWCVRSVGGQTSAVAMANRRSASAMRRACRRAAFSPTRPVCTIRSAPCVLARHT